VIGGGIINGITQAGDWPRERVASILKGHPDLVARWERAGEHAAIMVDSAAVPPGTRYDALRILGVGTWEERGPTLFRFLLKGVNDELQMGAISGLGDVRSPVIGQAILSGFSHYSEANRELALDVLVRDESRIGALLDAIEEGRVRKDAIGDRRVKTIREKIAADSVLRARAESVLGD
jgi:hypothetical protein